MTTRYMQHIEHGTIYAWSEAIANDPKLRYLPPGFKIGDPEPPLPKREIEFAGGNLIVPGLGQLTPEALAALASILAPVIGQQMMGQQMAQAPIMPPPPLPQFEPIETVKIIPGLSETIEPPRIIMDNPAVATQDTGEGAERFAPEVAAALGLNPQLQAAAATPQAVPPPTLVQGTSLRNTIAEMTRSELAEFVKMNSLNVSITGTNDVIRNAIFAEMNL